MVMRLLGRRAVVSGPVLVVISLAVACGGISGGLGDPKVSDTSSGLLAVYDVPVCDTFRVDSVRITIPPRDTTIELGGGNRLIVPRNAVTTAGRYQIAPARNSAGRRVAGLSIDPVDGATSEFNEPLELQLSYRGCPFETDPRRFVIVKRNHSGKPFAGGAKSTSSRIVRVLFGSLTEFAIAI